MFWKKKKQSTVCCSCLMAVLMKALAIYFGVLGVRLSFMCYDWLCWDALLSYIVAVMFFMWGKGIHMQCCSK